MAMVTAQMKFCVDRSHLRISTILGFCSDIFWYFAPEFYNSLTEKYSLSTAGDGIFIFTSVHL